MWQQNYARESKGYTLAEVLVTILVIGLIIGIAVGINFLSSRRNKDLLYTARQFGSDLQNVVQQARSRSQVLTMEITASSYRFYRETGEPGFHDADELVLARDYPKGISVGGPDVQHPAIPLEWGNPSDADDVVPQGVGSRIELTGRGLAAETAVLFYAPDAIDSGLICVHLLLSGDTEILRSSSDGWAPAPFG